MEQVILRNKNDWDTVYTHAKKVWDLFSSEEETPTSYPCIFVSHEVINNHNKRDNLYYDFVYPSSFKA